MTVTSTGHIGPQGPQGSPGSQGFQGNQGRQGNQGTQGNQGATVTGPQGFQGNQGFQGVAGGGGGGGSGIAAWQPSTAYTSGSWVSHDPGDGGGPYIYTVTTNFTSGLTFSATNLKQAALRPGDVHTIGSNVFSQGGSAQTGVSGSWRASAGGTITRCNLDCVGAPAGSDLIVQFRKNSSAFLTLTVLAGNNAAVSGTPNTSYVTGDLLDVNATSVGSGTAATNVAAQMDYDQVIA